MPLGPQETLESGLALPSFHWEPYREHRPQGPEAQRRRVGEPKPSSAYSHRGSSPTRCVPIHSWGEETLGKRTWHRGPRDPEMHGRGWTGMRSGTGHLPSAPLSAPPPTLVLEDQPPQVCPRDSDGAAPLHPVPTLLSPPAPEAARFS